VLIARTASGGRCVTHWGAPADEARLRGAVGRVLEANGIARPAMPSRMARYVLEDVKLFGSHCMGRECSRPRIAT